jgi:putative FmdB family regulatory protein
MPVYDYGCATCGPFEATRPMAEFDRPVPCPGCGAEAPRVLLSVPFFATMDGSRRNALATNERSASEPSRFKADGGHGASCSCCRPVRAVSGGSVQGSAGKRPGML